MPNISLSILPYLFSALVRLSVANAMGLSMLLSWASSLGQLLLLLVCCKVAPSPTPGTYVSMYSGFVSSQNFMHASSFMIDFALSSILWYVAFQVHSVLVDVKYFFRDSQVSAVLGKNFPK